MLALLIINRTAGDGEPTEAQLSAIQTWIARGDVAARVEFTSAEKSAREITREGLARGIELFIVAGGDGTVGEVARELIGKAATLAILPVGTFNNIARSIGILPDMTAACAIIVEGHTATIDVGVANAREHFFEAAGVGLDATLFPIGEEIKGGRWGRMFEAMRLTLQYRRPRIAFTVDGRTRYRRALLVVVANGPYYGSGFTVAPGARLSDGRLTVTIYRKFSKLQLARHFWSISRGRFRYSPRIETFHGAEVTIHSPSPLPVHVDGRPIGTTPVTIRTLAKALRVIVPKRHVEISALDAPVALPAEAERVRR